jgi:hypothetical protein
MTEPSNQPDVTLSSEGAPWVTSSWDTADWAGALVSHNNWTGVGVLGRVGAPRFTARVLNCQLALTGFDVLYESGSIFG